MNFSELNLRPELLRAISELGYITPTEIQEKAIPVLLEGGGVAGVEDLPAPGKGQRIGFDRHRAHRAGFNPAPAGFGLGKRGVAPASFLAAFLRTVGWLSLTPST